MKRYIDMNKELLRVTNEIMEILGNAYAMVRASRTCLFNFGDKKLVIKIEFVASASSRFSSIRDAVQVSIVNREFGQIDRQLFKFDDYAEEFEASVSHIDVNDDGEEEWYCETKINVPLLEKSICDYIKLFG